MYIYNEDAARAIYEDRSRNLQQDADGYARTKRPRRGRRRKGRRGAEAEPVKVRTRFA